MPRRRPIASARALWRRITARMEPIVFFGAALAVVLLVVFGGAWTSTAQAAFDAAQSFVAATFGWVYALAITGFLVLMLVLGLGPYGRVRLGRDDDRPEFPTPTWFAMHFGAGMGTGLVFFGVAEPLTHWNNPPLGAEARTEEAAIEAMRLSFFHWGLHPWSIYITLAAALTLMHFRLGLPLAPRSLLWPLIGDRIHGWIGHGIDILCTVGTLVGVAASLGLGAMQINTGMERLGLAPQERSVQLFVIAAITAVATVSVVSGIHRGIRRLSQANLVLGAVLLVLVLLTGPTLFVAELGVTSLGRYAGGLFELSLWIAPFDPEAERWQESWTLSYWGWWLAWSPFVGVFVARISRGRTPRLRERESPPSPRARRICHSGRVELRSSNTVRGRC